MEKLKSAISQTLILSISQSNPQDLHNTCSSLHEFFNQLPQFHQMIEDLAHTNTSLCHKNEESALEFKLKGNNCLSNGDNSNALRFYTQALRVAPRDVDVMGKNLVATLYVNRAVVLQKMGLFLESLRDCNRALAICRSYSKAWYRRGKANTSMQNYNDAVCDLKVSLCMEHSLSGKRQIEGELKLILGQNNGEDFPPNVIKCKESDIHDQLQNIQLQCVETETKGRGMVSLTDIPQATLLHAEEPYAAIVSKNCRETHCHFCFNELPADIVPCSSCSMALYCSQLCQIHARGQDRQFHTKKHDIGFNLSSDLENYVASVTKAIDDGVNIKHHAEHKHECGVNWPIALPAEIVLAGRVIVKSIEQNKHFGESSSIVNLELCHNYLQLDPEAKLELHISSIVLMKCLHHCYGSDIPLTGDTISQCVLLLSQIKVNSMAIVRMRSAGSADSVGPPSSAGNNTTSTVEQVRVGQAIYLAGSLYNHSCQPNIHTYFLSRTLYIRAIGFVTAGHPLELSYGPQVGQWSCNNRQSSLKEQYAFVCSCTGCSQINLSDLVINSFRCTNKNCSGVVLDISVADYEQQKINPFSCGLPLQVGRVQRDEVKKVASFLCEETGSTHRIKPGFCLSCGAFRDLEASNAVVKKAEICIGRLEGLLDSGEWHNATLSNALRSLDLLKSALHPYNKKVAEAEDYIAQAFCLIGELQRSHDHCQASIKILEKLYGDDNIVIGNEMVKLASIQLFLGEHTVEESRNRISLIFSLHYGSHVDAIFPHLQFLNRSV
ncbi:putative chromatin remodeling SET family [Helianthus annuus]|nr:putative chromatin remodeling SET family [Helianthus annuus]